MTGERTLIRVVGIGSSTDGQGLTSDRAMSRRMMDVVKAEEGTRSMSCFCTRMYLWGEAVTDMNGVLGPDLARFGDLKAPL